MEVENGKAFRIPQWASLFCHWVAEQSLSALRLYEVQLLK